MKKSLVLFPVFKNINVWIKRIVTLILPERQPEPVTNIQVKMREFEKNLETSRQYLKDILQIANMAAREIGFPHPEQVGLLARANQEVSEPYNRQLLQKRQALELSSRIFGSASPQKLQEYKSLLEERQKEYYQLHNRLCLIRDLLHKLTQQGPWAASLPTRLLLEHPEIFEARLNLEQLRRENQHIALRRLQNSFQKRLNIGENWLNLVNEIISSYAYRLGRRTLKELSVAFSQKEKNELKDLKNLHKRLDTPQLNWNKRALTLVSSKQRVHR